MTREDKIFLEPEDDIKKLLKLLKEIKSFLVVVSIPKNSILGRSINNFELLKKEVEKLNKEVWIESVDEHILELAEISGFKAFNPIFKEEIKAVTDILPRIKKKELISRPKPLEAKMTEFIQEKEVRETKIFKKTRKEKSSLSEILKISAWVCVFVVIGAIVYFSLFWFLPKARISITFKKEVINFQNLVEANKDFFEGKIENNKITIPGELISVSKNLVMKFPASGREKVEKKAKGKLTIYNVFSSAPQTLVANTRFLSPDGKIFRLDKQVVIPGAKVIEGRIEPSSIEVEVTADKPGEEYNLKSVSGIWRIPGFQGTPRYEGFYAKAFGPFSGGFIGEKQVPTKEDIEKAKTKMTELLKTALENQFLVVKEKLKFLEGSSDFKITQINVNEEVDEKGQFEVFLETTMKKIGFDEEILKKTIVDDFKKNLKNKINYELDLTDFEMKYNNVSGNFEQGSLVFVINGRIIFKPSFDIEKFRKEISGLSRFDLANLIYNLPGLENARISLWPFWVNSVPRFQSRIELKVD